MNLFLTGATGFVGRPLTQRLLREGHRVTAMVRNSEAARATLGPKVTLVATSASDMSLLGVLSKTNAIINLAGEGVVDRRWTRARRRALYQSRVGTTTRLVRLLRDLPTVPGTLISASAVGYYGSDPIGVQREESVEGPGFLARLCGDWEHAALAASALGVRVVTLRTGIVLGHHGGALAPLVRLFRLGLGARLGHGDQMMSWIHVHDMLEVIMRTLHDPKLEGPVNAVGPHPVSNREFTAELACALGRPARLLVPGPLLRVAMGRSASVVLGGQDVLPSKLQDQGFEFRHRHLGPALHDLVSRASLQIRKAEELPPSPYLQARGARYELTQETRIDAPLAEVFEFFSKAENLSQLSPPKLKFKILSKLPIQMAPGARIDYSIAIHGLPLRWSTKIESYQPLESFVDTQESGPYRSWWHEHRFESDGHQTIMKDRVLYSPPLGPLGAIANRLIVANMLRDIFDYRQKAIALYFSRTVASEPVQAPALRIA